MAKKKSFVLYADMENIIEVLNYEDRGRLLSAVFAYYSRGEQPDFDGALKAVFIMIAQQLDRDREKWEETCRRRSENVKKRWSKDKSEKQDPNETSVYNCIQKHTNDTDNDTVTDNETENDTDTDTVNDIVIVNDTDTSSAPFGETTMTTTYNKHNNSYNAVNCTKFVPPSLEEVRAYCEERGNGIDAQYFMDYYSARGWKVGRNVITDWKAVVRNWERREAKSAPEPERPAFTDGFDLDKFYSYADSYDPEKIRFTDD